MAQADEAAIPGSTAGPNRSAPPASPRRAGRREAALVVAAVVLLGVALALPWWSEATRFGPITEVESYSPWTGVTVACSPTCSSLTFTPAPTAGVNSFESMGLSETALLYRVALGLAVLAVAAGAGSLVPLRNIQRTAGAVRSGVRALLPLGISATAAAAGSALLPLLQPLTLSRDLIARFYPGNEWIASPSPESSFWGACTPGRDNGVCASGGTVSWGPGLGWFLLLVATVLLVVALLRSTRRARPADGPASLPPQG